MLLIFLGVETQTLTGSVMSTSNVTMSSSSSERVVSTIVHAPLTTRKLTGPDNFLQWKNVVMMSLVGRGKDNHLRDDPPSEESSKWKEWRMSDANLVNLLWDCMDTNVSNLVSHCSSVKQLWTYLDELYSGRQNTSRMYDVVRAWSHCSMDSRNVTEFFGEFSRLSAEFDTLLPIASDIKQMIAQRELLKMLTFLRNLRPEFSAIRSQILGDISVVTLSEAYARVLRAAPPASVSVSTVPSVVETSALFTAGRGGRDGGRGFSSG